MKTPAYKAACVLTTLIASACSDGADTARLQRLADLTYADLLDGGVGTARHPILELDGRTRTLCSGPATNDVAGSAPFTTEVGLAPGSTLHFAFALAAAEGDAEFVVTVADRAGNRAVFRDFLDGSPGRETGRWHHATLDLEKLHGPALIELAGVPTRIDVAPAPLGTPAGPLFSCPLILPPKRASPLPNVILISLDTLRADRLGIYGYTGATSPRLDARFHRDGLVVERAYSQASNTLRGHAAILTGLHPAIAVTVGTGVHRTGNGMKGFPTLADHLRRHGYLTAAFTESGYVSSTYGMAQGFDVFHEERSPEVGSGDIEQTFSRALEWAEAHAGHPMFLFLHTYEVHNPYDPPPEFRREETDLATSEIARDSELYDAEIAYVDRQLDELLERLGDLGILEHAIVVVTSDHGEEFGEHGGRYHGAQLHDEIVRIPLLVAAPGLLPRGERRGGPAGAIDIMPTILDLVGAPIPDYLSGISLRDHWIGDAPLPARGLVSEAFTPIAFTVAGQDPHWLSPSLSLTAYPHRVIRVRTATGARHRIFDLVEDPQETRDLAASIESQRPPLAAMIETLERYEHDSELAAAAIAEQLGIDLSSRTPAREADADHEARLRALGYLE